MTLLLKSILVALVLVPLSAVRADEPAKLPPVPSQPIAKKKELLFADDFKGRERDKRWHRVVDIGSRVEREGSKSRRGRHH